MLLTNPGPADWLPSGHCPRAYPSTKGTMAIAGEILGGKAKPKRHAERDFFTTVAVVLGVFVM